MKPWSARMGHFSGWAGAVALAVIVVPVVVRTTEDMLLLVPNQLREAASALGMPRSLVIRRVAYRAARAGMITGVLLAVARISRRDRAPAVHRAQQSVLEPRPQCAHGELAGGDLPVRALSPYKDWQQLAWAGRADHHVRRAGAEHHGAHVRLGQGFRNDAGHDDPDRTVAAKAAASAKKSRSAVSSSTTAMRRR